MSVKAMGLVWDLECPGHYNKFYFRPTHKFILIAYADHADHNGKNIYPAVATIAKKTGYNDRTVQRITTDLETMGLLIEDGYGPRGTNRWGLPYNDRGDCLEVGRGDSLSGVTACQGDKNDDSLGDIPSGDIPSGDSLPPELNKPNKNNILKPDIDPSVLKVIKGKKNMSDIWRDILEDLQKEIKPGPFSYVNGTYPLSYDQDELFIAAPSLESAEWLESRLTSTVENILVGYGLYDVSVRFTYQWEEPRA